MLVRASGILRIALIAGFPVKKHGAYGTGLNGGLMICVKAYRSGSMENQFNKSVCLISMLANLGCGIFIGFSLGDNHAMSHTKVAGVSDKGIGFFEVPPVCVKAKKCPDDTAAIKKAAKAAKSYTAYDCNMAIYRAKGTGSIVNVANDCDKVDVNIIVQDKIDFTAKPIP